MSNSYHSQGSLLQSSENNSYSNIMSINNITNSFPNHIVNAPTEYSDRARDTIKKRLLPNLQNQQRQKHHESRRDNNSIHDEDDNSIFSDNSSCQSSIFSHPVTTDSSISASSFSSSSNNHYTTKFVTEISLEDALPKTFYDMYQPEILMSNPSNLFHNGRPKFTKRELMDWDLNDIRSLLIIENLRPEWGNQLPKVILNNSSMNDYPVLPTFRFQLLPLYSSDTFIIETLVNSDLYLEANLDYEFQLTSAKYTVAAARKRHEQVNTGGTGAVMNLTKPEWRNIIENYLLNIAVEAQCRFDFKQRCSEYKKWKQQQLLSENSMINLKKPDMPPPSFIPLGPTCSNESTSTNNSTSSNSTSLLKKTLMKNLQLKNSKNKNSDNMQTNENMNNNKNNNIPNSALNKNGKIVLNKEEKAGIWSHCQANVYKRLGLNWKPDGITSL